MTSKKNISDFPDLMAQWSPSNNSVARDFKAGSNQKVMWICKNGHEWDDTIAHRIQGRGCPFCSNKRVGYGNSFADQRPELLKEWDAELNDIDPRSITTGSSVKVWWKCKMGHSWQAKVEQRTKSRGSGCPYCSGRLAPPGDTLFDKHPNLEAEWDPENSLNPKELHPGTLKSANWICPNGHKYTRKIRARTKEGLGCPQCNSFAFQHPDLAKTWHPNKNLNSPYSVSQGSGQKAWWLCEVGHEWEAVISSRRSHGCPYCAGQIVTPENNFEVKNPELAKFWDYSKNPLPPNQVLPSTNKKFSFICEKGHKFSANLNNVSNGKWCPYCSNKSVGYGNSLAENQPGLALEWNSKNYPLTASDVTSGSNKSVWWQCKEGHEWQANVSARASGSGCPYCSNRSVGYGNSLADLYPEIAAQIATEKSPVDPREIGAGSSQELWWRCSRGHEWKAPVSRRTLGKSGCRYCSSQTSAPEIKLYCELKELFGDVVARERVEGFEADVFLPNLQIVIEYDGAFFHKDKSEQDYNKKQTLERKGFHVLRMRERPLKIGQHDVGVSPSNNAPSIDELCELIGLIAIIRPDQIEICNKYIAQRKFIAENEFRRILSYLPGPPEESSLKQLSPQLACDWNYEKNFPLRPEMFHPNSGKKVWWRCENGHEWEATINKRSAGRSCPYCSNKKVGYGNSLAEVYPDIAKEWFSEGNGKLSPHDVTPGSGKRVWWKCENGHIFKARVADKANKGGKCLYCPGVGRNRKYVHPESFD